MGRRVIPDAQIQEKKNRAIVFREAVACAEQAIRYPYGHPLHLQATIGNQAVQRFLRAGVLQAKLSIGRPDDICEQEADRVAGAIMTMPDPGIKRQPEEEEENLQTSPLSESITGRVQRHQLEEEEPLQAKETSCASSDIDSGFESELHCLRGSGSTLPPSVRDYFEPRFGHDFSQVQVHTDARAADMAQAVNAKAFTMGRELVFGAGQYAPETNDGKRLLAHELTHVVQQQPQMSVDRKEIAGEDERAIKRSPLAENGYKKSAVNSGICTVCNPLVQRDLAVPPPNPTATARKLTEAEITAAIEYNRTHFKDSKSLENIRDVIGISPTPAVSDRDLALTIAQWQAEFGLIVDGKAGDRTVGTIVRELKAEKLKPDGLKLLLDFHRDKPTGRATLKFLPVLHDAAPAGWGVTTEDDPIFDISVYARSGAWHCVITKADQQCHQGVRLLPGVVEVTPALVAAENNCAHLQTAIASLNTVANQGADSGYYMVNAVQAHENVHITQYRTALAPHYLTLKTAIEALTVPLASQNTAATAKNAIKALPAYTVAMATFHAADVAANNATAAHPSAASFNTAEHGVVDPMIATITARRTALGCAP
jgi:hypothetical protein